MKDVGRTLPQTTPNELSFGKYSISPDGEQIYTGEAIRGQKGTVQKWNVHDGRLMGSVVNYDHGIEDLKISPDGASILTSSRDQTIRLWDAKTLGQRNVCEVKGRFATSLVYLPDGKSVVAVFDDKTLRSFDTSTMHETNKIDTNAKSFLQLASSPDGSVVATADTNRLQLWRPSDGAPLASVSDTGGRITAIQFSSDGKSVVAYASSETHLARLGTISLTEIGRTEENYHACKTMPSTRSGQGEALAGDHPTSPGKRPLRSRLLREGGAEVRQLTPVATRAGPSRSREDA